MQDRGREKSEIACRARNVERARERQWFAGVYGLSARKFVEIALDQICNAQQNFRALRRRRARPIDERPLSGGYGKLDITRVAVGNLRIRIASRWFDVVEVFGADRLDKLAIDKISNLD